MEKKTAVFHLVAARMILKSSEIQIRYKITTDDHKLCLSSERASAWISKRQLSTSRKLAQLLFQKMCERWSTRQQQMVIKCTIRHIASH